MVNPRGGGQHRGRGGFSAPQRRDGSVPGQRQASRSPSRSRGSSRGGRGEGGGGRGGGEGRGRGHQQASGSTNSQRERRPDEKVQRGGGDGRGRGQWRRDNQHHHQGKPSGSITHRPVIRGGLTNASLHSRGIGRPVQGLMHQHYVTYLLPATCRTENTGHQQASGSMTDGTVGPEGVEPQRGREEGQRGRGGNGRE